MTSSPVLAMFLLLSDLVCCATEAPLACFLCWEGTAWRGRATGKPTAGGCHVPRPPVSARNSIFDAAPLEAACQAFYFIFFGGVLGTQFACLTSAVPAIPGILRSSFQSFMIETGRKGSEREVWCNAGRRQMNRCVRVSDFDSGLSARSNQPGRQGFESSRRLPARSFRLPWS